MFRISTTSLTAATLGIMIANTSIAGASAFPSQDWSSLGSAQADFRPDRDVFSADRVDGRLNGFRFKVLGNAVSIYSVKLVYEDGGTRTMPTRRNFMRPGTLSQIFRSNHGARRVAYVEIGHSTVGPRLRGRARVKLLVHKTTYRPPHPGPNEYSSINLANPIAYSATRKHVVKLPGFQAGFRAIKFKAHNHGIIVRDIKVRFRDGSSRTFSSKHSIFKGATTRDLSLSDYPRSIRRISFRYRVARNILGQPNYRPDLNGRARVQLIAVR